FGDRLRVVFRENPLVPTHQFGLVAAQAAEAAGLQGEDKFWAMHDKLFENQGTWSAAKDVVPLFVDYAKQIGLDPDRFMRDINGVAVAIYLTVQHLTGESLRCTIISGCSEVLSSPYAQIGPLPLASIGAIAYFAVFSLAILAVFRYRFAIPLLKILLALMFLTTL